MPLLANMTCSKKLIWICPVVLIVFMLCLLYGYAHYLDARLSHYQTHETKLVARQLAVIQEKLQGISNFLPEQDFKDTFQQINSHLSDIDQSVQVTGKVSDLQEISARLLEIKTAILDLQNSMTIGKNSKAYIDAKSLPFVITAIDLMASQPFVSIEYDHHVAPLGIADTAAGWQLVSVDYSNASAEFKNAQGQFVSVILQG